MGGFVHPHYVCMMETTRSSNVEFETLCRTLVMREFDDVVAHEYS